MQQRTWRLHEKAHADFFSEFAEFHPVVAQLFYNRDIRSLVEARDFLHAEYEAATHDPYLMDDMRKAVDRIIAAIRTGEHITVYGDYDIDGVCASTILYDFLECLGAHVDVYMNHRENDGYGLQLPAIDALAAGGTTLIITNDSGISNKREVVRANELGMEVIITDHHHVPEDPNDIPPAYAIIHPLVRAERYPFKHLAGGGTAFKLVQALIRADFDEDFIARRNAAKDLYGNPVHWEGFEKWLLDVVCISTIGDCMPLIGENRVFVRYGLMVLNKTRRKGLQMLMEHIPMREGFPTVETVGYYIGPRINAASRMDHGRAAFDLMIARTDEDATHLANYLEDKNTERQKLTELIYKQALAKTETAFEAGKKILVAYDETWPLGVLGLVAGKIAGARHRPVILMTDAHNTRAGTARSVTGFHVAEYFKKLDEYLERYGGHAAAGGFALKATTVVDDFIAACEERAHTDIDDTLLIPNLPIDTSLRLSDATLELAEMVEAFQPFGQHNPRPRFIASDLSVLDIRYVGKTNKHIRLTLEQDGISRRAIGFSMGQWMQTLQQGDRIDMVCELGVNTWNGHSEVQLSLVDILKRVA